MPYRILIRSVNVNVVSFNWFGGLAGNALWETEDEEVALQQYRNLIRQHPVENITLVRIVPVDVQVTFPS